MKWYKAIVDNDGILSLNEEHIEEGLDQNDLQEITIKYYLDIVRREYLSPLPPSPSPLPHPHTHTHTHTLVQARKKKHPEKNSLYFRRWNFLAYLEPWHS